MDNQNNIYLTVKKLIKSESCKINNCCLSHMSLKIKKSGLSSVGERQTEDLEAMCSIHIARIYFLIFIFNFYYLIRKKQKKFLLSSIIRLSSFILFYFI